MLVSALATCVALSAVGIAAAEKPTEVGPGSLRLAFDGDFAPKVLPKKTLAPIVLNVSGKIQSTDPAEPQPSPLTGFILNIDRNIAVDLSGYPTCSWGGLAIRRDLKDIEEACETSIIGTGSMAVSVKFSEQPSIPATSKLLLLNEGTSGGKATLYAYANLTQPITTAIVTTVEISKVKNGRFGTKAVATVPPIANRAGAVTSFNLRINKGLKVEGKPFSVVSASCPDRHLTIRGTGIFEDGTEAAAKVTRPCTGS